MTAGPRSTGPTGAKAPWPARTAVGVAVLAAVAGLVAGVGLAAITAETGCRPDTPALGRPTTSPPLPPSTEDLNDLASAPLCT
jgi:hypothetical protein